MGFAEMLFLASVLVPPSAVVLCILSMLIPTGRAPAKAYENRVHPVSN